MNILSIDHIIVYAACYLLGSIPVAYLFIKIFHKKDIRKEGSGNVGTLNAFMISRSKLQGTAVLLADFLKGALPVLYSTKTITSTPDKMKGEALVVLDEVESFKPDMVFTVDDDAFREVGLKLRERSFPVVFTGMNGQPENYNKNNPFLDSQGRPSSNITGVYEQLHFQTAINVMKGVIPDLKKIVALLDMSPTGKAIRIQLEKELSGHSEKVEVVFKEVGTMKDYLREISEINKDPSLQAVYPVVLSVVDRDSGVEERRRRRPA